MTPVETLLEVGECAFWKGQKDNEFRRPVKVGEFYNNLPEEIKEKLKNLKSDDLRKIRFDAIDYQCWPGIHPPVIKECGRLV